MTANQINFARYMEEQRANKVKEVQNEQALYETQRANLARESENTRANTLNYQASIYNAQASMYNAQLNYDANVRAIQQRQAQAELQHEEAAWNINQGYQKLSQSAEIAEKDRAVQYLNAGTNALSKVLDAGLQVARYLAK